MSQDTSPAQPSVDFDKALIEAISHLRDVSIRDGVQSLDANKWPIDKILDVTRELGALDNALREYGGRLPPIEAWGGGQVAQPAKFLGEDPLVNLEQIHEAGHSLDLQCLYRGRQAFGFIPVSREVQEAALNAAVDRGIKVIRIFDMMNDISNVTPGIEIMNQMKKAGKDIKIEGAISYISEPDKGKRAWELKDYADYAEQLAKLGCDEIVIKNYAGVGDAEMPKLIKTIRDRLNGLGMGDINVNLHTHGQKPQVLVDAIKAGADKVDVAFGKLSGGSSHSNIIDTLKLLLKQRGFDVDGKYRGEFADHPIVHQMRRVEEVVNKYAKDFEATRAKSLTQPDMDKYRMAGGALSDLWANYLKDDQFGGKQKEWVQKQQLASGLEKDPVYGAFPPIPKTKDQWYEAVLQLGTQLWEKGGRFNTVTPGAAILCQQAVPIMDKLLAHQPILMKDYTPEYLDLIIGRYGKNRGMENGIGDQKFRDAAMMFRAFKKLNEAVLRGDITADDSRKLIAVGLGYPDDQPPAPLIFSKEGRNGGQTIKPGMLNLDDPMMEKRLKNGNIEAYRAKVQAMDLPHTLVGQLLWELTPGKSPDPQASLEVGRRKIEDLKSQSIYVEAAHKAGRRVSSADDAALLVMLLRNRDRKTGEMSDVIADSLFRKLANGVQMESGGHVAEQQARRAGQHGQQQPRM
jgi:oxaloacetate decarboxylase (Na+ extruding) subunit alpha